MSSARRRSLRRELLVVLLSAVTAAWLLAASVTFFDARHEISEVLDAHLAETASVVMLQWDATTSAVDTEHAALLHPYSRRVMFQVWEHGSQLRLHSQHAPDAPLSPVREGFSESAIQGARWRVFSAWDPDRQILVQTAEQLYEREELTAAIARNFVVPLIIALPVIGLVVWAGIGRVMRSIANVNHALAARAANALTPIDETDAPLEINPLIVELNRLFGRVHESVERERHFTADAAHELRTPLAAIRAQAQVALGANTDTDRTHALESVMAGCDRATHTIDQMLTLARLAPDTVSFQSTAVDVEEVLQTVIADLAPFAFAKNIDVELTASGGPMTYGDAGLLAILFRNVIDNAIRYSTPSTRVEINATAAGAQLSIAVTDTGPGIRADDRSNIGRRFYRAPGTQAPGSGLGLSIAQRIVDLHHGAMEIGTAPNGVGLRVQILLPIA